MIKIQRQCVCDLCENTVPIENIELRDNMAIPKVSLPHGWTRLNDLIICNKHAIYIHNIDKDGNVITERGIRYV